MLAYNSATGRALSSKFSVWLQGAPGTTLGTKNLESWARKFTVCFQAYWKAVAYSIGQH